MIIYLQETINYILSTGDKELIARIDGTLHQKVTKKGLVYYFVVE